MPIAELAGAVTSLKASFDLAKALLSERDDRIVRARVDELIKQLGDAYIKLLEAQQAQLTLLHRNAALEAEIAAVRKGAADLEQYELKGIGAGATAYMLKPAARGSEPPSWLCPTCFAKGQKAHLQPGMRMQQGMVWHCSGCKSNRIISAEPRWVD